MKLLATIVALLAFVAAPAFADDMDDMSQLEARGNKLTPKEMCQKNHPRIKLGIDA